MNAWPKRPNISRAISMACRSTWAHPALRSPDEALAPPIRAFQTRLALGDTALLFPDEWTESCSTRRWHKLFRPPPENKLEFKRPIREARAMSSCPRDAFASFVKARRIYR